MKAILPITLLFLMLCACDTPANPDSELAAETAVVDVMDQPLDGSSIETFDAGLERVKQEAGEMKYKEVQAAIGYLMFYDVAARKDRKTLYSRLDGMTPREVIKRAEDW